MNTIPFLSYRAKGLFMNSFRFWKYLSVFTIPVSVYISFTNYGLLTFLPVCYAFIFIPLLELFFKPDHSNLGMAELEMIKKDITYDLLLYAIVPIQIGFVLFFLNSINELNLNGYEIAGRISAMGIMCGVFGINVAHELGHRSKKTEQFLSKTLLMTSLYMHFFIEHNRGHHKNVATLEDPSSARYGENLYFFWLRSIITSYLSAWKIEMSRLRKKGFHFISIHNQMLSFQLIQIAFLTTIFLLFGFMPLIYFIIAALIGCLLLESVNYIEHYGLERKMVNDKHFERVKPHHSWNSDHIIGRVILFELSRHSDHHYLASKKYQTLAYHPTSLQMPTGYPGMIITALIPPLWFSVMHRLIKLSKVRNQTSGITVE